MQYEATWATELSLENNLVLILPRNWVMTDFKKHTTCFYGRISSFYYLTPRNCLREQGTGFDKMLADDK